MKTVTVLFVIEADGGVETYSKQTTDTSPKALKALLLKEFNSRPEDVAEFFIIDGEMTVGDLDDLD